VAGDVWNLVAAIVGEIGAWLGFVFIELSPPESIFAKNIGLLGAGFGILCCAAWTIAGFYQVRRHWRH
jgi:hypothetical protein